MLFLIENGPLLQEKVIFVLQIEMKIEDKIIFVMAGNSTTINARNISCFVKVIGGTRVVQA